MEPEVVLNDSDGKLYYMDTRYKCVTSYWSNFIEGKIYEPFTNRACKNKYGELVNCDFRIIDEDGDKCDPTGRYFEEIKTYTLKTDITDRDVKYMKRIKQRIDSFEGRDDKIEILNYFKKLERAYVKLSMDVERRQVMNGNGNTCEECIKTYEMLKAYIEKGNPYGIFKCKECGRIIFNMPDREKSV